jgi:hypothetical protein
MEGTRLIVAQDHCQFDGLDGEIGFRLCADGKTIILMCDECHAVWLDPEHLEIERFLSPQPPEFVVPGLKCSVRFPESRWATREEVTNYGWSDYIVGEIPTEFDK